jgi:hypothetical protein
MMRYSLPAALLALATLASPLLAREVSVTSTPAGATVEIVNIGETKIKGGSVYKTNAIIDFRKRPEPYTLRFTLPEHEPVTRSYNFATDGETPISVTFDRVVDRKLFSITSEPAGADVVIGNKLVGTTPLRVELTFNRPDSRIPGPRSGRCEEAGQLSEQFVCNGERQLCAAVGDRPA